jgi:hypothetical protein
VVSRQRYHRTAEHNAAYPGGVAEMAMKFRKESKLLIRIKLRCDPKYWDEVLASLRDAVFFAFEIRWCANTTPATVFQASGLTINKTALPLELAGRGFVNQFAVSKPLLIGILNELTNSMF